MNEQSKEDRNRRLWAKKLLRGMPTNNNQKDVIYCLKKALASS